MPPSARRGLHEALPQLVAVASTVPSTSPSSSALRELGWELQLAAGRTERAARRGEPRRPAPGQRLRRRRRRGRHRLGHRCAARAGVRRRLRPVAADHQPPARRDAAARSASRPRPGSGTRTSRGAAQRPGPGWRCRPRGPSCRACTSSWSRTATAARTCSTCGRGRPWRCSGVGPGALAHADRAVGARTLPCRPALHADAPHRAAAPRQPAADHRRVRRPGRHHPRRRRRPGGPRAARRARAAGLAAPVRHADRGARLAPARRARARAGADGERVDGGRRRAPTASPSSPSCPTARCAVT